MSVVLLNTWILMFHSLHSHLSLIEPCSCLRYGSSQINTTNFPSCLKSQFFLLFGNIIPLYFFNHCWSNDSLNNTTSYNWMYSHLFRIFTMTHFSCTIWRINTPTMIKQIQWDYVIHIYISQSRSSHQHIQKNKRKVSEIPQFCSLYVIVTLPNGDRNYWPKHVANVMKK